MIPTAHKIIVWTPTQEKNTKKKTFIQIIRPLKKAVTLLKT